MPIQVSSDGETLLMLVLAGFLASGVTGFGLLAAAFSCLEHPGAPFAMAVSILGLIPIVSATTICIFSGRCSNGY